MAGEWIPVRTDLHDDPDVIRIANLTGLDEHGVIGRLVKFWAWANRQLLSGTAQGISPDWVDRYLATPGFAAALIEVDWLRARSGLIEVPNFDRWNSQGAKKRLEAARRMRKSRGSPGQSAPVSQDDEVAPCDADVALGAQQKCNQRRGEESTENQNNPPNPLSTFPVGLDTAAFRDVWARWVQHRQEVRKPLKPTQVQTQLKKLATEGERAAIERIERSIANGWQGLWYASDGGVGRSNTPSDRGATILRQAAAAMKSKGGPPCPPT